MATVRKVPPYRGEPYWERETPVEAGTRKVGLAFYPKAGKLQIFAFRLDPETGEKRRGRTVTLDYEDLRRHREARELLARVLREWEEEDSG